MPNKMEPAIPQAPVAAILVVAVKEEDSPSYVYSYETDSDAEEIRECEPTS